MPNGVAYYFSIELQPTACDRISGLSLSAQAL